ncbi:hypothetical protein DPMN_120542 [Dreissena polymorpha]|uniref:Uncharacterized protein n=1 Tax=Dreissena polymorpha TaxID=45954 RepID=A0A9D4GNU7_DREPO|nr:hypothetical protein DPMN_120542 [Dreissena polymorpha]
MPVESRQSAGLLMQRSYSVTLTAFSGLHQGVDVALPGSVWAPVELRCRSGCSRCRPGCSRCRAVVASPFL